MSCLQPMGMSSKNTGSRNTGCPRFLEMFMGFPIFADNQDELLTAKEIATELRVSKAQVYKVMNGEVKGCARLPTISIRRKKVVRRSTFEKWKQDNELNGCLS